MHGTAIQGLPATIDDRGSPIDAIDDRLIKPGAYGIYGEGAVIYGDQEPTQGPDLVPLDSVEAGIAPADLAPVTLVPPTGPPAPALGMRRIRI